MRLTNQHDLSKWSKTTMFEQINRHRFLSTKIMTSIIRLSLIGMIVASFVGVGILSAQSVFPANFRTQEIQTEGATIHVRVGGQGPAVVLLHGFGDTGDMWALMAAELAHDHRVVVPDLRGMGLSSHPAGGYD